MLRKEANHKWSSDLINHNLIKINNEASQKQGLKTSKLPSRIAISFHKTAVAKRQFWSVGYQHECTNMIGYSGHLSTYIKHFGQQQMAPEEWSFYKTTEVNRMNITQGGFWRLVITQTHLELKVNWIRLGTETTSVLHTKWLVSNDKNWSAT